MVRVCFVCLGNICRSPAAEAIFGAMVKAAGLDREIDVDSAGTGAMHVGERADERARDEARGRGLEIVHEARQFVPADFKRFQYIVGMDTANLRALKAMPASSRFTGSLSLMRSHDPASPANAAIPDPFYGSEQDFAEVFDLCETACKGLLERIAADRNLSLPQPS